MGDNCAKCGKDGLESGSTDYKIQKHGVRGTKIWEMYETYCKDAGAVSRKSDFLCGVCYYKIRNLHSKRVLPIKGSGSSIQASSKAAASNRNKVKVTSKPIARRKSSDAGLVWFGRRRLRSSMKKLRSGTKLANNNSQVKKPANKDQAKKKPVVSLPTTTTAMRLRKSVRAMVKTLKENRKGQDQLPTPRSTRNKKYAVLGAVGLKVRTSGDKDTEKGSNGGPVRAGVGTGPGLRRLRSSSRKSSLNALELESSDDEDSADSEDAEVDITVSKVKQSNSSIATSCPAQPRGRGNGNALKMSSISMQGLVGSVAKKNEACGPHLELIQGLRRKYEEKSLFNWTLALRYEGSESSYFRKVYGNLCILDLWKLRSLQSNDNVVRKLKVVQNIPRLSAPLEILLKFLHTGESIPLKNLFVILETYKLRLVNNFIIALAVVQSVLALTETELSTLKQRMNKMEPSLPKQILTICTKVGCNRKDAIMEVHQTILGYDWDWTKGYVLDGSESENSFRPSEKENFFFWLFSRYATDPSATALSFALEKMRPMRSVESRECFIVNQANADSPRTRCEIHVHPLILQIRQGVSCKDYRKNKKAVEENLRSLIFRQDELNAFLTLLYYGPQRLDLGKQLPAPILVKLCKAFRINPLTVISGGVELKEARNLRLFMDNLERTKDFTYLDLLFSDPYTYLKKDSISGLKTTQLCYIFENDALAMKEIDIFNLATEFCQGDPCADEDSKYKDSSSRFDRVSAFIRFGIMSKDDFSTVITISQPRARQPRLSDQEIDLFFFIIMNPTIKREIPPKFHKPTTTRRSPQCTT